MKTTLEIADSIFRRAKAAQHRMLPRQFVNEAMAEKRAAKPPARQRARIMLAGGLPHLRKETARIDSLMEEEFEKTELEDGA